LEAAAQADADVERACTRYREALAIKERLHKPKSSEALECRWRFGRFLLAVERTQEAVEVLEKLAEWSAFNREVVDGERSDFLHAYAGALAGCGRQSDADEVKAEADRLYQRMKNRLK
jgi:hypothetical protein